MLGHHFMVPLSIHEEDAQPLDHDTNTLPHILTHCNQVFALQTSCGRDDDHNGNQSHISNPS